MKKPTRNNLTFGEQMALDLISARPDELTLAMLVAEMESTPGSVKVMISRLRAKGYKITSPRFRDWHAPRLGVPQTYRLEGEPK